MKPATSDRNFVPSSTEAVSPSSTGDGTAEVGQIVHGHVGGGGAEAAVVNDHVTFAASALPATSLARGSTVPPRTRPVYFVDTASEAFGWRVAVRLVLSYVTSALTT